jgi:hypothetical protein
MDFSISKQAPAFNKAMRQALGFNFKSNFKLY